MASLQGEHVFNAVGNLAAELEGQVRAAIAPGAPDEVRDAATAACDRLRNLARDLIAARDNDEFRSADAGDPANSHRYAQMTRRARADIIGMATGGPSEHTQGYTDFNRMLNEVDYYTVDEVARASRRNALGVHRRGAFDTWFNTTRDLISTTLAALRDAALAVNRTRA